MCPEYFRSWWSSRKTLRAGSSRRLRVQTRYNVVQGPCTMRRPKRRSRFGLAIAFSSFAVVRAEHASPDKSKISCNKSTACFEGTNTGSGPGIAGVGGGTGISGSATAGYGGFFQNNSDTLPSLVAEQP